MINQKRHILIIEDEKSIGESLKDYLEISNYSVKLINRFQDACEYISQNNHLIDIAICDINLPDGNGLDIIKALREKNTKLQIICLSALNEASMKVNALNLGADDYMTKPFDLAELDFRLNKIVPNLPKQQYRLNKLTLDLEQRYLFLAPDHQHTLTKRECDILACLIERSPNVVSRDELIAQFWEDSPSTRTVDNYIVKLRKLLAESPQSECSIQSVRGIGYRFNQGD